MDKDISLGPWRLASGETVQDRTPSHVVTGHPGAIPFLERALARIVSQERPLIEETLEMGEVTGSSACVPCPDDNANVFYAQRPGREGHTRFVREQTPLPVSTLAVSASWDATRGCYVLETAYAGVFAPPEPYDDDAFARRADPDTCRREAYAFWRRHALTASVVRWLPDTKVSECPWPDLDS